MNVFELFEAKKKSLKNPSDNPCWTDYHPVGTKQKSGRTVPNCVPNEGVEEAANAAQQAAIAIAKKKKSGVAERQVNEVVSVAGLNTYQEMPSYKNYKIFVSKRPYNQAGNFLAYSEIGRTEIKAAGKNAQDAVRAIQEKIDQMLNATKVEGSATLDFNVKFATDILGNPRQPFFAKIISVGGEPKLVMAGNDMLNFGKELTQLGFKPSALRIDPESERAHALPSISYTKNQISGTGLIANGRYELGNAHEDQDGNTMYDLVYHSTAHTKSDKIRLNKPAFTVGTVRTTSESMAEAKHQPQWTVEQRTAGHHNAFYIVRGYDRPREVWKDSRGMSDFRNRAAAEAKAAELNQPGVAGEFKGELDSKDRFTKDTVQKMFGKLSPDAKGVAEGSTGEFVGGTAGGVGGAVVGATVGGPMGALVGGAAGGTAGQIAGRELTDEQKLNEIAPLLALGARLFMAAAPKIAQVAGKVGQAGARGVGQAAKAGAGIAAKNAGQIGVGAGAYEIGSSVADIVKDITAKVGAAVDEKTIFDLATLAFKYAIPAGIVLAILYGGKKAIDSLFADPKTPQGVAENWGEPLTGWHVVYARTGNKVSGTPNFNSKDSAHKYLLTKMSANHHNYRVAHADQLGTSAPTPMGGYLESKGMAEAGHAGADDTDTIGFYLDTERAYQAVMGRYGDMIDHDETSGIMYVPARLWPKIEMIAFDADGIGALRDDDLENPEHYGIAEAAVMESRLQQMRAAGYDIL